MRLIRQYYEHLRNLPKVPVPLAQLRLYHHNVDKFDDGWYVHLGGVSGLGPFRTEAEARMVNICVHVHGNIHELTEQPN